MTADLKKKTDFNYNSKSLSRYNFLVCGSHERNADTIILVTVDFEKNVIDFFSIPRDLYYKGRKINSYYKAYGAEKLTEIISLFKRS